MARSILGLLAAFTFVSAAHAGADAYDPQLDPSFQGTGSAPWQRAYIAGGGSTDERVVGGARTPDGGYVVAAQVAGGGAGAQIFLAKFRPDGTYDASFGGSAGSGRVLKDAYLTNVADMTVDAQGRIVVAGSTPGSLGQRDFAAVRFLANGADDTSFAGDGGAVIGFDQDAANGRTTDIASSVTTGPDGSVYLTGTVQTVTPGNVPTTLIGISKFLPNGTSDESFGTLIHGRRVFCGAQCQDVTGVARMVYDASRNRLVVGGDYAVGNNNTDWFIVTLALDNGAGQTYSYAIDYGGASGYQLAYMRGLTLQRDGQILAVGFTIQPDLSTRPLVIRRQADSVALDGSFGSAGKMLLTTSVDYTDLALDSAGRILLAGHDGTQRRGVVTRLQSNGTVDTSFNFTGLPSYYTAPGSGGTAAYDTTFKRIFLDAGRPVLVGEAPYSTTANTDYDVTVTRLKADLIFENGLE